MPQKNDPRRRRHTSTDRLWPSFSFVYVHTHFFLCSCHRVSVTMFFIISLLHNVYIYVAAEASYWIIIYGAKTLCVLLNFTPSLYLYTRETNLRLWKIFVNIYICCAFEYTIVHVLIKYYIIHIYVPNVWMIMVIWECFYLVFLYVSRIICFEHIHYIFQYIYTLWPLFLFLGLFQPCWLWNIIYVKE